MKIGYFILKEDLRGDARMEALMKDLTEASFEVYEIQSKADVRPDTDLVLSMGGDGTFLSAAHVVADIGLPILGVNFGRIGFLCENRPEAVRKALMEGDFSIEYRTVLNATLKGPEARRTIGMLPYSVNEVALHRSGSSVLGIHVSVDGEPLPTYWADGLLVATPSGSTAYSLSVGGPICTPEARVLILAPIAPHNLNIRPIVVPDTSSISLSFRSREPEVMVTMDNRGMMLPVGESISVSVAQFSLKRIRLDRSNFIQALKSKLFWGEDVRNL